MKSNLKFIDYKVDVGFWPPREFWTGGFRYCIKCSFKDPKMTNAGGYIIVDEKHKWLRENLKHKKDEPKRYVFLQIKRRVRPINYGKIGVLFRNKEDAMAFKLRFEDNVA